MEVNTAVRALQPEIAAGCVTLAKWLYLSELRPLVRTMRLPSQVAVRILQVGVYTQHRGGHLTVVIWPLHTCSLLGSAGPSDWLWQVNHPQALHPAWVVREGFPE